MHIYIHMLYCKQRTSHCCCAAFFTHAALPAALGSSMDCSGSKKTSFTRAWVGSTDVE